MIHKNWCLFGLAEGPDDYIFDCQCGLTIERARIRYSMQPMNGIYQNRITTEVKNELFK